MCLIDGGAGVNIVTKTTCERFGWLDWLPVPFLVRMADQRRVRPLGILRNLVLSIGAISFAMAFVVMNMEDAEEEYSMLLGRPWLRQAIATTGNPTSLPFVEEGAKCESHCGKGNNYGMRSGQ